MCDPEFSIVVFLLPRMIMLTSYFLMLSVIHPLL